jgi:hypothetical protein
MNPLGVHALVWAGVGLSTTVASPSPARFMEEQLVAAQRAI